MADCGTVAARRTPRAVTGRAGALEAFRAEGCGPAREWSNGPGDRFGWHDHPYHKVLFCLAGGIVFHTREGDVGLGPGDRLDLDPGTQHAATVGPEGVSCIEAPR
ncbi:MAG TPA: cupin domain-containing protein [Actinomycetota bacterium]|nr:cupin domain-containing protein [Actinomycetota bacterium]